MTDNNKYSEFPAETEQNVSEKEFATFSENKLEYSEFGECEREFAEYTETDNQSGESSARDGSSGTSESTSKSNNKITTGVVAVAGVAVIAISLLSGRASFTKFDIYGTSVDYTLETTIEYQIDETTIMEYDNFDTNLRIITYSDQTENTDLIYLATNSEELACEVEEISKSDSGGELKITFDGVIDGLFEGTRYTTQVVGEDENGEITVYLTKTFTTTGAQTFFSEIEWECKCRIDGCFYFTMIYIDDSGYYDNFSYKIISASNGEVFAEGEISDPASTQRVNVEEANEMFYILEISFDSTAPIDISNGEASKVYQIDVNI